MLNNSIMLVFAFVASVIDLNLYIRAALRNKIISSPNFRTLHSSDSITAEGTLLYH